MLPETKIGKRDSSGTGRWCSGCAIPLESKPHSLLGYFEPAFTEIGSLVTVAVEGNVCIVQVREYDFVAGLDGLLKSVHGVHHEGMRYILVPAPRDLGG